MKQRILHGAVIDALTADELVTLLPRPEELTRVRSPGGIALNGAGGGSVDIYKVPVGYEYEVRRLVFTLTGNAPSDPNTGNVVLTAAGKFIALTRSGQLIEYAAPTYGAAVQVPGTQTWGDEQGPFLSNGEVLGVVVAGLTPNVMLNIYAEGILKRPKAGRDA